MKKILLYPMVLLISTAFLLGVVAFTVEGKTDPFLTKITQQITRYWKHTAPEKVYVQLDRTLYVPGETIWLNAFLRAAKSLRVSERSEVLYVELYSPKSSLIKQLRLHTKDGAAHGDFQLSANAVGGRYKIKAYTQWQKNEQTYFEKEILVQRSVLPNLKMKLDFDRKAFGPGAEVVATLDLQSLTNKALANHPFEFVVQLQGSNYLKKKAKTDALGKAKVTFSLPKDLATTDGLLNVLINYQGQRESIARSIPIVLNDIDLQFLPEGGLGIVGMPIKYAFKAINEYGKPADVEGVIYDQNDKFVSSFKSFHQGMGAVQFTPAHGVSYYAKITHPAKLEKKYLLPSSLLEGYTIAVNEIKKSGVYLSINNKVLNESVFLIAQVNGQVVFKKQYQLSGVPQKVFISTRKLPIGVLQITLFDSRESVRSERLVFINKQQQLKVDIQTDKKEYLPREKVKMSVQVKDAKGKPVQGSFSLAVSNDQLLNFADDKQATILASLLLESELKSKVEEANFYFDPTEKKADQALDYLMLTQGWRGTIWKAIQNDKLPNFAFQNECLGLSGKVTDLYGKVIPQARVALIEPYLLSHSKDNGAFDLPLEDFTYESRIVVSAEGYEAQYLTVTDYTKPMEVRLKKAPWTILEEDAEENVINGIVIDQSTGEPLPFTTVTINQRGKILTGVNTDFDGKYKLDIPAGVVGDIQLEYKYVGFNTTKVPLWLGTANRQYSIQVRLQEGVTNLSVGGPSPLRLRNTEDIVLAGTVSQVTTTDMLAELSEEELPRLLSSSEVIEEDELEAAIPPVTAVPVAEEPELDRMESLVGETKAKKDRSIAKQQADHKALAPPPPPVMEKEEIFSVVEEMPRYYSAACESLPTQKERNQCANESLSGAIYQRLKYPKEALLNGIQGRVIVSFTVDKEGRLKDLTLVRDIGGGCGQAALESVHANVHEFVPGKQRGVAVPVRYNMPISFRLAQGLEESNKHVPLRSTHRAKANTKFYLAKQYYTPKYESNAPVAKRTDFRSTIYWNPNLVLDKQGRAEVEFPASDEITAFRATLEGLSQEGGIGQGVAKFYTQRPFNVLAKLPTRVLTGDQLQIPITLVNNTEEVLKGELQVTSPSNFELLDRKAKQSVRLKAFGKKTVYLKYLVKDELVDGALAIRFAANGVADELASSIRTYSRGFPVVSNQVGTRQLQQDFELDLQQAIDGSVAATLNFFPSVLSEVITGMDKMLRHPGGCFEQTSSSNYPNVLVLNYLRKYNLAEAEIETKAKQYLQVGYARLTGFEAKTGGFEWYGRDPGHEALTAYGIMQFVDMAKVFNVDPKMIERTSKWLLGRRDGKGGWLSNGSHGWYVNNEIGGAYVVWALCEAGFGEALAMELNQSYADALKSEDPYLMALMANSLQRVGDVRAMDLLADLMTRQNKDGSWKGQSHSGTRSRGDALTIETTALVAMAMMNAKKTGNVLNQAIQFITKSKNNYGFGNTQSTILALKALIQFAELSKRTAGSGKIVVKVNGKKVKRIVYDRSQADALKIDNLAQYLKPGKQTVSVAFLETKEPLDLELSLKYTSRQPASDAACRLGLSTKLQRKKIKMGETVRFTGTLTNLTKEVLASPIAMIGIPAGLSVQAWQLKEMQERQEMAFYEIFEDQLVFYYDDLAAQAQHTIRLDLKADIPGTYEAPASKVYEYYQNEWQAWSEPEVVVIRK